MENATEYSIMKLMEILQDKINTHNRLNLQKQFYFLGKQKQTNKTTMTTITTKTFTTVMAQMSYIYHIYSQANIWGQCFQL